MRSTGAVLAWRVLVLAVAGCSSSGRQGVPRSGPTGGGAGQAAVNTPRMTFAMVTHSGDGDTFWDIVQSGAKQAAAKDNVKFLYAHNDEGKEQAQLVQSDIDQKVDGLIVTLAKPDAMKDVVAKAEKAGIPVITINSGGEFQGVRRAHATSARTRRSPARPSARS